MLIDDFLFFFLHNSYHFLASLFGYPRGDLCKCVNENVYVCLSMKMCKSILILIHLPLNMVCGQRQCMSQS